MRSNSIALVMLSGLALFLLVSAFYVAGGPIAAQVEKRDERRLKDITRFAGAFTCMLRNGMERFPETLDTSHTCFARVEFESHDGGVPYRYERLSDDSARICADFENIARLKRISFVAQDLTEDGCVPVSVNFGVEMVPPRLLVPG